MTNERVLIAEHSADTRRHLEDEVLGPAGYRTQSVGDGMSALALAQEYEPDLVIVDQGLPSLSGLDLVRRLHQEKPQLPVILTTAASSETMAVEALRAGAADFLVKPYEAEKLLAAAGRALGERRRVDKLIQSRVEAELNDTGMKRRVEELEALAGVGRAVTALLDLDEVLTSVVDAAVRLTAAEEGSLLLVDEESGQLYMRASKNFDEDFAHTFRLQVNDSLAGQVLGSGEPVVLDERSPQKIKTSYLVHSLIYVPLRVHGQTLGVLGVDNRKLGRTLTRSDLTVLVAMADYAAIAIENARLYQRTETERRKLETVLTQTENGVIVVDGENRLVLINRAAQEALGVNGRAAIGQSIVESLDEPRLLNLLRAPGDHPRREEIELPDGRIFNAQRTAIEGVGQSIVLQDITHLKELDRIKSEFVTTVSHDLRSPLTAILGYVELIERAGEINDQQRDFIHRVQLSVQQITNLVTDLLDLGRIEAGLETTRESSPISVLARYAVEGLRASAETRGLVLEAELPEDLPLVSGDPIRIRQMIGNLLDNAIKYTPRGGTVGIRAAAEGDQIILKVYDSGPGIPPADQPYLFDKFFRASNVADRTPGTGLGLSIVKSIVDHHDGRIWVESALGKGTTFTVVLPSVGT